MVDKIELDESEWPLIKITMPDDITDAAWQHGLEDIKGVLARKTPFAFCALRGGAPTAKQRKLLADMMVEQDSALRAYCRGWAAVAPSAIIRGVITAINWLKPPPFEQRTFSDAETALAWCRERLRTN